MWNEHILLKGQEYKRRNTKHVDCGGLLTDEWAGISITSKLIAIIIWKILLLIMRESIIEIFKT